jgi:hypothetical protein
MTAAPIPPLYFPDRSTIEMQSLSILQMVSLSLRAKETSLETYLHRPSESADAAGFCNAQVKYDTRSSFVGKPSGQVTQCSTRAGTPAALSSSFFLIGDEPMTHSV